MTSPELCPGGHAWVIGPRKRLATETRDGRHGWATGIRQEGMTVTLSASSGAASLLGTADCQSLRLIIVGDDSWTFVMHPLMGIPTLNEDTARCN